MMGGMRIRQWTPEETDAIVTAYVGGATAAGLRSQYDTGWTQIAKVLRSGGVYEGRQRSHQLRYERDVCDRYVAGQSLNQIAAADKCSVAWILKILERHGVARRPARPPEPEYVPKIQALREQGLGARRIAKELGIGITTANKWAKRCGLPSPRAERSDHKDERIVEGYRALWLPKTDPLYVMAWKSGFVPEHRLVMARSLGRPLEKSETVHHINGDKMDNRLENLQLRQGKHGKGARFACLDCGSHNVVAVSL
jgi:transposase-like protein